MRGAAFASIVVVVACAGRPGPPGSAHGEPGPAASSQPDLVPGPPARPTPLTEDPLWQRAAAGDPIDLGRLADRAGAAELSSAVALGGTVGLTALSALPYADDAELALGPLCELSARTPPERLGPVLAAIDGVLRRPVRPTERLDAKGILSCRSVLARLRPQAAADRDRVAVSRALVEEWLAPQ